MSDLEQNPGLVPPATPQSAAEPLVTAAEMTEKPSHTGIAGRLRNYFLTGLILTGPLYITINLTWWFINWVDDLVRPFIPPGFRPETYLPFHVPGLGLIIVFITLTLLGFLTANLVGRTMVEFGEMLLGRMPIIRPIYKGLKQIFETLFSKSGTSFRRVGLIEFPSPGKWSLVFISQPPSVEVAAKLPGAADYLSVFMPCTPNPTTGFYFYVARTEIIELDVTVESAMTLIMSAGMVQPGGDQQKRLSALAEAARAARTARAVRNTAPAK